jgi:pimeloyl-ACP methyl ester carboxylesterase
MSEAVSFTSAGLRLAGILEGRAPAASPVPAVVLLHGFGSNKSDGMVTMTAAILARLGYTTLRFDMRGCGDSEGERARVLCEEQVEDVRSAVTYLRGLPGVRADRVAVMGHSFGAAVAVYATAMDKRICACISSAGWGDGTVKLRQQHNGEEAWRRFSDMVAAGRTLRQEGKTLMVPRFDIVPIPPAMRSGLPAGAHMEFPFEVVESMLEFRPNEVVAGIAPRPLLLLHPAADKVTPSEQSIELFRRAKAPVDLHLFANIDHFIFSDDNKIVLDLLQGWLHKHLPVTEQGATAASEALQA